MRLMHPERRMERAPRKTRLLILGMAAVAMATTVNAQQTSTGGTAAAAEDEEIIALSPFEVSAGSDEKDYFLSDTLAGTRIRSELGDVAAAITVIGKDFLADTASTGNDSLLVYAMSTEVGGSNGNFLGNGDGLVVSGVAQISNTTRVRGLANADDTRGFFITEIPWDSYNTTRIDLQRGPNSVLFGLGSPGGIVNATLEGASFKNSYEVSNRLDEHGSIRWSGSINQVIIEDELAVRISGLHNSEKYKQDPAFKDDRRLYGAVRWKPGFLKDKVEGMRSVFKASYESGSIKATLPNLTPPLDYVSPYFNDPSYRDENGNLRTFNPLTPQDPALEPFEGSYHIGGDNGNVTAFNGGAQGATNMKRRYGQLASYPTGTVLLPLPGEDNTYGGAQLRGIMGLGDFLNLTGEYRALKPYKLTTITDPRWFDFHNNTLDGPNYWDHRDFSAVNAAWEQTFMNDTLGYELVYDRQTITSDRVTSSNPDRQAIHVDTMNNFLDGSPNPNVGRLFHSINGNGSGIGYFKHKKESLRLTAFYALDFAKISNENGWLAKIFGTNNFTGLYEQRTDTNDDRGASLQSSTIQQVEGNYTDSFALYQDVRNNSALYYFGPSYAGTNTRSPTTGGGSGIKERLIIQPSTMTLWDPIEGGQGLFPAAVQTINQSLTEAVDRRDWGNATLTENKITSKAIVWQGSWLDNTIVPLYGWRRDKSESRRFVAPNDSTGFRRIISPDIYKLPDELEATVEGDTKTWGVVLHAPANVRDMIGGLDISPFYTKSENFRPEAGRKDFYGDSIPNPSGETQEYGVAVSTADGKYRLRLTKYKTEGTNVTLAGSLPTGWYVTWGIEWGSEGAYQMATDQKGSPWGVGSDGRGVWWRPDGLGNIINPETGARTYDQAQLDGALADMDEVLADWFSKPMDPRIVETVGYTNYFTDYPPYGRLRTGAPIGGSPVVTGSTLSEGYEFEMSANPIRGLNIVVNISKTSAKRTGLASSYDNILAEMDRLTSGPAGRLRIFGNANNDDPAHNPNFYPGRMQEIASLGWWRGWYNGMKADYDFYKALENSDVAELRPWAMNAVVNYDFLEGGLKGLGIGGSVRYQDSNTTGFPIISRPDGSLTYDVEDRYRGGAETNFDIWFSYNWKIGDIGIRTHLIARNVTASEDLIPTTVQPDGSPGAFRIAPPRTVYLTNTFRF